MKEQTENLKNEKRTLNYSKVDVIKLDTKCLYAGKLERIKEWHESPHSHPICEIMFVFVGKGEVVIGGKTYPIAKGDIIVYNPHTANIRRRGAGDRVFRYYEFSG